MTEPRYERFVEEGKRWRAWAVWRLGTVLLELQDQIKDDAPEGQEFTVDQLAEPLYRALWEMGPTTKHFHNFLRVLSE